MSLYTAWRLKRLLISNRGRNRRAGRAAQWTGERSHGLGLDKLSGTIAI
jgi:hypothetical protein